MTQRIYRLSPHQNGKVMGILWATVSLTFMVMLAVFFWTIPTREGVEPMPVWFLIVLPLFYFVMTYLMTALMCWVYNLLFSRSGGLEFEMRGEASSG
jgi:apolipoprotein N-acyltransferase